MSTIRIEIDMNDLMPEAQEEEEAFSCPAATMDTALNAENKQVAIEQYSYGPTTKTWENKNARCGTCEYFNLKSDMMRCISDGLGMDEGAGYCESLHFVCSADNVCNMWELGGPITDGDVDDYPSDMGNSRDMI